MPKKKLYVILTVPHALCSSKKYRDCDTSALNISKELSDSFKKYKIDHRIHIGDKLRQDYDLNRIESSKIGFHKNLNSLMRNLNHKNLIILDIHSHPNCYGFRERKSPLIILIQPTIKQKQFKSKKKEEAVIKTSLLLNNIYDLTKATIFTGSKDNYIVEKGLKYYYIPSLLLEFNERITYSKPFLNLISKALLQYEKRSLTRANIEKAVKFRQSLS